MNYENDAIFDAAVVGVLGITRRETLTLAVALQRSDSESAAVAASRLRYSLAYAQQLASRSAAGLRRLRRQLDAAEEAAQLWLPQSMKLALEHEPRAASFERIWCPPTRLAHIRADDSLLVALDLNDLPLVGLTICRSTVAQVTACRAHLDNIAAVSAKVSRSRFDAAQLRLGDFSSGTFNYCDFLKSNLDGSKWKRTVASNCNLSGAVLFHADLSGAHFVDCDLRDADLQGFPDTPTVGATFIRCDLRRSCWHGRVLDGVTFIDCKLYGVYGQTAGLESTLFERPDLSPDGDGRQLVAKKDVLAHWAQ